MMNNFLKSSRKSSLQGALVRELPEQCDISDNNFNIIQNTSYQEQQLNTINMKMKSKHITNTHFIESIEKNNPIFKEVLKENDSQIEIINKMLEDHRRKKGLFNNAIIERDKENISVFANKNESKSKAYKIYRHSLNLI